MKTYIILISSIVGIGLFLLIASVYRLQRIRVDNYTSRTEATQKLFRKPINISLNSFTSSKQKDKTVFEYSIQIHNLITQVPRYFLVIDFIDDHGSVKNSEPIWIDRTPTGWSYGYYIYGPTEARFDLINNTLHVRTLHDQDHSVRRLHVTVTAMKHESEYLDAVIYDTMMNIN